MKERMWDNAGKLSKGDAVICIMTVKGFVNWLIASANNCQLQPFSMV